MGRTENLGTLLLLLPDVVHQAAGMMTVQMDVPVNAALVRLCTLSQESRVDVADIAELVVAGLMRFDSAGCPAWQQE